VSLPRTAKHLVLAFSRAAGIQTLLKNSAWRSRRLLILGYHGVSMEDEHEWAPTLFLTQERLRRKLEAIRGGGCTVLPLGEAVERLYAGTLPPRSVALTFDDGMADFACRAWPVLREFGYPATVYWTTYYAGRPRPLPGLGWSYLLWKARGQRLEWPEVLAAPLALDASGREQALAALTAYARQRALDAAGKDALTAELARRLAVDYERLCASRILQIMRPEEAAALAHAGVDLQLHTHRHHLPDSREAFEREIRENCGLIRAAAGHDARHFCYPSGWYHQAREEWMREAGIVSAVTCDPGLASPRSHPLFLPRLMDGMRSTPADFEAWLSGVPHLLPRRRAH